MEVEYLSKLLVELCQTARRQVPTAVTFIEETLCRRYCGGGRKRKIGAGEIDSST